MIWRSLFTALAVFWSMAASPLGAATFLIPSDRDLTEQGQWVVDGSIQGWEMAVEDGMPVTRYDLEVERLVKGTALPARVTVRVPGGYTPDGLGLQLSGAPRFAQGERVLLFLMSRGDGTLGVLHLTLGAFHAVPTADGQVVAVRDLSGARLIPLDGAATESVRLRDFQGFARWIEDRALGIDRPADYFLDAEREDPALWERFTLLENSPGQCPDGETLPIRWFSFPQSWAYRPAGGQPGMTDGGLTELDTAMAAWNAEPASSIDYGLNGVSSSTGGCAGSTTEICFDDPADQIDGSFSCSSGGGVLAIGGAFFSCSTQTYNGRAYRPSIHGFVVTQDGAGCFFGDNGDKNGEEVFAHELGHSLGLGHSSVSQALMRANAHGDGRGASLHSDDRAGVQCLYGDSTTCPSDTAPAAPSDLSAAAVSSSSIALSWIDNSDDEDSFEVQIRPPGGTFGSLGTVGSDTTGATVSGLDAATTYDFRVRACNAAGCSAFSNVATATTEDDGGGGPGDGGGGGDGGEEPPPDEPLNPPDDPPSDLQATAESSTSVALSWQDNSANESSFRLERATGNGAFFFALEVPADATEALDGGRAPDTQYRYRVQACNADGCSAFSNVASVHTDPAPPPPGTLTAGEVACDGERMAGLLSRLAVTAPQGGGTGVNLGLTATGDFAGLAHTVQAAGQPERHLAFSTNPEETTLLRNPARLQLFAVSLTRNRLNSDLVAPGSEHELALSLNPTLELESPNPATLLAIDNVEAPADGASDAKPGRGLTPLLAPCHDPLSARDVHVLRVLSKTLRAEGPDVAATEIAIYRGEAPDTYRVDVYPFDAGGQSLGRLTAELEVGFGPGGALEDGLLRVLPACAANQTTEAAGCTDIETPVELTVVRPVFSGELWPEPTVRVSADAAGPVVAEASFSWDVLLDGTTWERPR